MKKIIAVVLCLAMLLACTAVTAESAAAETAGKVTIGTISINGAFSLQCGLPEGYEIQPLVVKQDQVIALIESGDKTKPGMMLSVAYDETYSDVYRMNDLDSEALDILEKTFTDNDPTIEISYGETGLGTELMIAKQTSGDFNYVDFLSVYQGYFVEFIMFAGQEAEDKTLTDDQIRMCIDFLTDLDFIPAEAQENGAGSRASQTCVAKILGYDAGAGEFTVMLREGELLDGETVLALAAGDTIVLSGETIEIETAEPDEYGDIILNDEIELRKQENGGFRAYLYDAEYLNDAGEIKIPATEDLVILDGIDPETGDILETPVRYTAEGLAQIMAAEAANGGVGFDCDNVHVTFDENGTVTVIERFYTPWQ